MEFSGTAEEPLTLERELDGGDEDWGGDDEDGEPCLGPFFFFPFPIGGGES